MSINIYTYMYPPCHHSNTYHFLKKVFSRVDKIMILNIIQTIIFSQLFHYATPHGRLMEPPMRASIWRFKEFQHLNPPVNYDDDAFWCGGMSTQYGQNGGKCGVCGDNWADPVPRDNEHGGKYGRGIIVREYKSGEVIPLSVYLTGAHDGYFEFRVCNLDGESHETDECYDKNKLVLLGNNNSGSTRLPATRSTGFYNTTAALPPSLKCNHCSLQWHYRTGNNWGPCPNGTYAVGCGNQETFRGCSDIKIK